MPVQLRLSKMLSSLLVLPCPDPLWSPGQCPLLPLCMVPLPLALVRLKHPTTNPNSGWCLIHGCLATSPLHGALRLHGKLMHGILWLRSVVLMRPVPLSLVLDVAQVLGAPPIIRLKLIAPQMRMRVLCPIGTTCHMMGVLRLLWVRLPSSCAACFSCLTMVMHFILSSSVATALVFEMRMFLLGVCSLS